MVQKEHKAEHKPPAIEHTSPIRNTPENFHQYSIIGLFATQHSYWTRTNETPLNLSSPLAHI